MLHSAYSTRSTHYIRHTMHDILVLSLFDLTIRQGRIVIQAFVPGDQMFGFASSLILLVYAKYNMEQKRKMNSD